MILLIEDNEDIRESLAELLSMEGFIIETANDGFNALKLAAEKIPDVVICDILMEGMDGFDVLTAFKQNKQTEKVPFIFSTSKSEKIDKQKAKELGASYYIVKPFEETEIISCIKKCLQETGNTMVSEKTLF